MRSTSDILSEGMWRGDLNDLLRSTVSIDEYESKVDEDAIVIGYYVHDMDAAQDLNRFLQKSAVNILDSDVSPAPDQKGYYIVFVELMRNDELAQEIWDLTDEVSALTNVREWDMSIFGTDGTPKMTVDALRQALKRAKVATGENKKKATRERAIGLRKNIADLKARVADAMEMLKASTISDMHEQAGRLVLNDGRRTRIYEVMGVGDYDILTTIHLDSAPISVEPSHLRKCRNITIALGEGWDASMVGDCIVVQQLDEEKLLVLKEI